MPQKVEDLVEKLLGDPAFYPDKSQDERRSLAFAIANKQLKDEPMPMPEEDMKHMIEETVKATLAASIYPASPSSWMFDVLLGSAVRQALDGKTPPKNLWEEISKQISELSARLMEGMK